MLPDSAFLDIDLTCGSKQGWNITKQRGYFVIQDTSGRSYVRLKARSPYPGTYYESQVDGSIQMGYGPKNGQGTDEFLRIFLAPRGTISIERDLYCTLPLYYCQLGNRLLVSNDFLTVYRKARPHIPNNRAIAQLLAEYFPSKPFTMWEGVGMLGERESLVWSGDDISVVEPPVRS